VTGNGSLSVPGAGSLDMPGAGSLDVPGAGSLCVPGAGSLVVWPLAVWPLAVRGQLAELVQDEFVPVKFGPDPQPRVLDDEVIGHSLARPQPVTLVVELSRPRG
jgi:hypothetical protein